MASTQQLIKLLQKYPKAIVVIKQGFDYVPVDISDCHEVTYVEEELDILPIESVKDGVPAIILYGQKK